MKAVNGCLLSIALAALAVLLWLVVSGCVTGSVSYTDPETGTTATVNFTPRHEK